MVQPTRIVCCACAEPRPPRTAARAPAAKSHLEDIRINPAPLFSMLPGVSASNMAQAFHGSNNQASRRSVLVVAGARPECVVKPVRRIRFAVANKGEVRWLVLVGRTGGKRKGSAISGSG